MVVVLAPPPSPPAVTRVWPQLLTRGKNVAPRLLALAERMSTTVERFRFMMVDQVVAVREEVNADLAGAYAKVGIDLNN